MPFRFAVRKVSVRTMVALALLATGALIAQADPQTKQTDPPVAKKDLPKPLPPEVVAAWQKAGAEVGWMRDSKIGFFVFIPEHAGEPGDFPAFRFLDRNVDPLGKLPGPAEAFGISLHSILINDSRMKELATFKNLKVLEISTTRVTDAGLKELAGMKLKWLNIPKASQTSLGLRNYLAAIEPPSTMKFFFWKNLSDEDLKELTGLKSLRELDL